ncbi:hypothetical protein L1987_25400 [Smallanthus sonchifolius]|uniref:Uncharacterized protein n=1 Tax=Smallanthus sonchifolius TaxID=185202 RepID=A0ACB9IP31_9ASTR|nr:hypothetical protein L1987_25400 [Smallanthus sonchifolius]
MGVGLLEDGHKTVQIIHCQNWRLMHTRGWWLGNWRVDQKVKRFTSTVTARARDTFLIAADDLDELEHGVLRLTKENDTLKRLQKVLQAQLWSPPSGCHYVSSRGLNVTGVAHVLNLDLLKCRFHC